MNNFYVTTPIYYPTGIPHIGTAYTTFIADTLARYHRQVGDKTFFLTGIDEHGANIAKKATEEKVSPQEYVDKYANIYKKVWEDLHISNDYFIQTTNPFHEKFTQELLQKSFDKGDIYPGEYQGWYCESCEAYYAEDDLVEGKCPNHPTKNPIFTKEKNYYFKWSKYADWLLEYYESHPDFVKPEKWYEYVKEFVKKGLKDIPVTRANVKWGVEVPFDKSQTIYVWYDALPNYLSVLNFPEFKAQNYQEQFWKNAVHVIGKDIVKFHAILWPAMLKSAGYDIPKMILVHGFFTINGQKIGKSNNNAINPVDLISQFGLDAIRYSLLSEFKVGNDGDFNFDRLKAKYDGDLSANWGNLHNRIHHLAVANKISLSNPEAVHDIVIADELEKVKRVYTKHMDNLEIFDAIATVNALASFGNRYLTEKKPWETKDDGARQVISDLVHLIKVLAELYAPILPDASQKAQKSLQSGKKVILFPKR